MQGALAQPLNKCWLLTYTSHYPVPRFPTRFMEVVEDTFTGPSEDLMFLVLRSSGNGKNQVTSIVDNTQPTVRIYLMILVVTQKKICQKMIYHN
jgi:hypothetical protein